MATGKPIDEAAKKALLRGHPLFAAIDDRAIDELLRYAVTKKVADGDVIFAQGDPGNALYGVLRGRLRIFAHDSEMRELTLNILDTGALFGEIAMFDCKPRTAGAQAMEDCTLLLLRRDTIMAVMRRYPDLAERAVLLLCDRLRWASEMVEDEAFLPLPKRLAKRLLALAESFGRKTNATPAGGGGVRIDLPLSQRELASVVGASREAVNRMLSAWRDQGLVAIEQHGIVLRDAEGLKRLLEAE